MQPSLHEQYLSRSAHTHVKLVPWRNLPERDDQLEQWTSFSVPAHVVTRLSCGIWWEAAGSHGLSRDCAWTRDHLLRLVPAPELHAATLKYVEQLYEGPSIRVPSGCRKSTRARLSVCAVRLLPHSNVHVVWERGLAGIGMRT